MGAIQIFTEHVLHTRQAYGPAGTAGRPSGFQALAEDRLDNDRIGGQ